jgi:hypothetical protein
MQINHGPIKGDIKINEMDDLETNEVQCNVKDIQDDLFIISCLCTGKLSKKGITYSKFGKMEKFV